MGREATDELTARLAGIRAVQAAAGRVGVVLGAAADAARDEPRGGWTGRLRTENIPSSPQTSADRRGNTTATTGVFSYIYSIHV